MTVERERERAALSATVVVSQKEKRLTRDLLGRKTRAREPKPEDEEDQGTQTTELSWVGGEAKEPGRRTEPKGVSDHKALIHKYRLTHTRWNAPGESGETERRRRHRPGPRSASPAPRRQERARPQEDPNRTRCHHRTTRLFRLNPALYGCACTWPNLPNTTRKKSL